MKKSLLKTKRSSRLNSSNRDFKKLAVWLVVILVLLFGLKPVVGTVSSWVTTPFFSIRHYFDTSSATIPMYLRGREELLNDIRDLEQEILAREGMHNSLAELVAENESLRVLLNVSSEDKIGAGVIARPPHTPYDVVLIDAGSKDGIVENAPVYYGRGKVLGYVKTVFGNHSLIAPISSPGIETSVYIFGPDIFVTAYGEGGGVIRLGVPQGIQVGVGDLVVAPSINKGIVGDVEHVESNPTEPEQHAYLTFEVPLQSIRLVSVGTEALPTISYEEAEAAISEVENQFLKFEIPETESESEVASSTEISFE